VARVPKDRVTALSGGEQIEGLRVAYTPGHASHHVAYFDDSSGDAYVGDVAGVRIPPSDLTLAPTPPPDIDLDAWRSSLDVVAAWQPQKLRLTHFGAHDANDQLASTREALLVAAERSRAGDREAFVAAVGRELADEPPELRERFEQAAPVEQLWLGLERYWRKRL
jgi:glyoxylase-like metal-dependent hydrolase (beta-lactamase superfamily II)